jgi:hypothetical protein
MHPGPNPKQRDRFVKIAALSRGCPDVVGDVAGTFLARIRAPASRHRGAVLGPGAGEGRPAGQLRADRHAIALHVVLVGDRDADHAGEHGRGELPGRRVVADDLERRDVEAHEVQLDALLEEEPARQPLEREPARHVVLLGVQGAAPDVPRADEPIQAPERGIGTWGLCGGVVLVRWHVARSFLRCRTRSTGLLHRLGCSVTLRSEPPSPSRLRSPMGGRDDLVRRARGERRRHEPSVQRVVVHDEDVPGSAPQPLLLTARSPGRQGAASDGEALRRTLGRRSELDSRT